jgi:hypothetical protein
MTGSGVEVQMPGDRLDAGDVPFIGHAFEEVYDSTFGRTVQGVPERFHLTLKKWLTKKPPAATLAEFQAQIDRFVHIYNDERPHTARGCPPMQVWRALDKAAIEIDGQPLGPHQGPP